MNTALLRAASTECIILRDHLDPARDTCLFVTHSAECRVKPHVAYHVGALLTAGFQVVLVCNTDDLSAATQLGTFPGPSVLVARRNEGFDFGAWADLLRMFPALWDCPRLLLVNDSIIGPGGGGTSLFPRLLAVEADLVGLVESYEFRRHLQSYFLLLNRKALDSAQVRAFWQKVINYRNKIEVIRRYELTFTDICVKAGLKTRALMQQNVLSKTIDRQNIMIRRWRDVLRAGLPYVKIETIRSITSLAELAELRTLIGDPALYPIIDSYIRKV
jgi:lipopolysaccharide biosynthesis protein